MWRVAFANVEAALLYLSCVQTLAAYHVANISSEGKQWKNKKTVPSGDFVGTKENGKLVQTHDVK